MEETPKPEIDCQDCSYSIEIGDGVRRSLIRHFTRFLDAQIAARGFNPHDGALFEREQIEARAWALADEAIQVAKALIDDFIGAVIQMRQGEQTAADLLSENLPDVTAQVGRDFLDDPFGGLDALIELASGHFPQVR